MTDVLQELLTSKLKDARKTLNVAKSLLSDLLRGDLVTNLHKIPQNTITIISLTVSYKNNYRSEGIRVANARTKMIIFCKSRPLNWN